MLGTNDIKPFHGRTANEAGRGMARLVQIIRGHYAGKLQEAPAIILVAPPPIVLGDWDDMMEHFGPHEAIATSVNFASEYRKRAEEQQVHFFDAGTVATTSKADGIHLDPANTRAIGAGLVPLVKQVLGL
jgi:lysophospholipase L1-like esterase